jgi:hypothetical protein
MVTLEGVLIRRFSSIKSRFQKRDDVDFKESLKVNRKFDDVFEDL